MAVIVVLVFPFHRFRGKTLLHVCVLCRLTHLRQASLIVIHLLLQTRGAPSLPISVLQITWWYPSCSSGVYVWALGIFSDVRKYVTESTYSITVSSTQAKNRWLFGASADFIRVQLSLLVSLTMYEALFVHSEIVLFQVSKIRLIFSIGWHELTSEMSRPPLLL